MRAAALLLVIACACGSSTPIVRPGAVISGSTDAMRAFGEIRDDWLTPPPAWAAISLRLERFIDRFPNDEQTPLARLYLANAKIELGDLADADAQVGQVGKLPPSGTMTDLFTVTRARLTRLRGQPEQALTALQPLTGKAVDPIVRELLESEVTLAAVAAHKDFDAIRYMDEWLRDTTEDHAQSVLAQIDQRLAAMQPEAVESALRSMRAHPEGSYSAPLIHGMATRLAHYAADTGNTQLAKWLLDPSSGAPLIEGEDARPLKDLATSLRGTRSVAGRSIGLVLPMNTPELRDAAADAARGVAFALDLPRRSDAVDDSSRLLTRAEGGGDTLQAALEELVGEGASIIIAGIDDDAAEKARDWGERNGVTIVLLGAPANPPTRFAFEVGVKGGLPLELLSTELVRRKQTKTAVLAGTMEARVLATLSPPGLTLLPPVDCNPPLSRARFPIEQWAKDHVDAVIVSGSDACARAVIGAMKQGSFLALGLRAVAGVQGSTSEVKVLAATVGAFPIGAPGARTDDRLEKYKLDLGRSPTWWSAIGYDAAILARKAVSTLPLDSTTNLTELTRRREIARSGMETAKASLWTSDASGFEGHHSLARTLRIVELPVVKEGKR